MRNSHHDPRFYPLATLEIPGGGTRSQHQIVGKIDVETDPEIAVKGAPAGPENADERREDPPDVAEPVFAQRQPGDPVIGLFRVGQHVEGAAAEGNARRVVGRAKGYLGCCGTGQSGRRNDENDRRRPFHGAPDSHVVPHPNRLHHCIRRTGAASETAPGRPLRGPGRADGHARGSYDRDGKVRKHTLCNLPTGPLPTSRVCAVCSKVAPSHPPSAMLSPSPAQPPATQVEKLKQRFRLDHVVLVVGLQPTGSSRGDRGMITQARTTEEAVGTGGGSSIGTGGGSGRGIGIGDGGSVKGGRVGSGGGIGGVPGGGFGFGL